MIIKRKLFTRQEAKAMKEIYQALKKGNIGRNLSARDFINARNVSNETMDALAGNGKVNDFMKNEEVIKKIGLPETSKAYKKIIEKYSNPELHDRFKRIQDNSSNSKLKKKRSYKKFLKRREKDLTDLETRLGKDNPDVIRYRNALSKKNDETSAELGN